MAEVVRSSSLIAALLVVTVLVAVAAVAIGHLPSGGSGPSGPSAPGELNVVLPAWAWGLLFLSPLLVGYGGILLRRLTEGSLKAKSWALLVLLAVGVLFLYLLAHGGFGGSGSLGFGTPGNSTGGTTGGGNNSSPPPGPNSTPAPGGATSFSFAVPPVVVGASAVVICGVIVALIVPGVASRLVGRTRPRPTGPRGAPPDRREIASALQEAAAALDLGEDPRETIVRLYVRLLVELSSVAGDLLSLTAEEVRRTYLVPLGVPAADAETLTRLFEEARYSTHAIEPTTLARAREAMRGAEVGLRQGGRAS